VQGHEPTEARGTSGDQLSQRGTGVVTSVTAVCYQCLLPLSVTAVVSCLLCNAGKNGTTALAILRQVILRQAILRHAQEQAEKQARKQAPNLARKGGPFPSLLFHTRAKARCSLHGLPRGASDWSLCGDELPRGRCVFTLAVVWGAASAVVWSAASLRLIV